MQLNAFKMGMPLLWLPHKLILVMKITTFLLLVFLVSAHAGTLAQRITLSEKNAPLEIVLKKIRIQSGYDLVGSTRLIKTGLPVSIDVTNIPLVDALNICFANQPLAFTIDEQTILVTKKIDNSFIDNIVDQFRALNVHGRIVDEKNQAIAGATVKLKDESQIMTTDQFGFFTFRRVNEKAIVVISFVGYKTIELPVSPEMGTISMEISLSKLDEVMIIGYGNTSRRLSTGQVSRVNGTDIERQPVSNPILALEGRVPGLFITQNAGYSGASAVVSIRGQNSFSSNAPLYVVDGVPFGSGPVEQSIGGFSAGIGFSPLNTINPSNIESISVLKDADATAIYGSRGANGVILITTKKGPIGNTRFSADVSSGMGAASHTIKMLSTEQYLAIRKQAFANDGVTPNTVNAPDLTVWSQTANTDFAKLLIGNTSHQMNANFSLAGGDVYTQFLFGGNYRHESTIFQTNTADNAEQFYLNVQHQSHDGKFGALVSVNYNLDNNTIPNYSLSLTNYSLPPNYPLYNPNGSLYFGTGYSNPLAPFNAYNNLQSANLITNAVFHYKILPGLDVKASLGYNNDYVEGAIVSPASSQNPLNNFSQSSVLNNNYIKTYIAEPQINYTHTWGKGKLTALAGGTWQETRTVQPYWLYTTFNNIQLARSLSSVTVLAESSGFSDYKYASEFSRVSYEWNEKFLVSANIRRDGSSRFGSDRQFGNFGSVAAAYVFSNETVIKNNLPWLSYGKLKTSYGTIGNDKIPDYQYESNYNSTQAYGPVPGLLPARLANPYFQWEVTKKFDAALELGFFKDRLFFSANYYRNRSSNLLGTTPLPAQVGFVSYISNLPATVQNQGLELELSGTTLKTKNLTWSTSFNLTVPQNKLVSFPNLVNSTYAGTYVQGKSLNSIFLYHFTGWKNGIATAQDVNNDGVLSSGLADNGKGDYITVGNTDPKYFGGLNNTFSYKGFQLDILFQFVKRRSVRGDFNFTNYPGMGYNIPVSALDVPTRYSATNGTAAVNAFQYYRASDASVEDASYIRLKTVSLAYNVPARLIRRMKMSTLQLYMHSQNLLTITKFRGLDPEVPLTNLPTIRMVTGGIKITF